MSRFVFFAVILVSAVVTLASACGGENKTAEEIRADQVLAMAPRGWDNVVEIKRVGEWRHVGDVLTAWARVKFKNKPMFVDCEAVDTAQRIDNDADIPLALETVPESHCQGERPAGETETDAATPPPPPPPPPPGPEWWTVDQASDRIAHSHWVRSAGLGSPLFDCIGQGRKRVNDSLEDVYRRFACTYEFGGPDLNREGRVVIQTTGRDTFVVRAFG
jgi:hypothetical protein